MSAKLINTQRFSHILRDRAIDVTSKKILVSQLAGSEQETDLSVPTNCGGYGRIRHFHFNSAPGWPKNPLPIIPACKALGIGNIPEMMEAQVFQNAACAWRCWYCYVPSNMLSANSRRAAWLTANELVTLYTQEENRPTVIDLSGGSPDLIPEWTLWMMDALCDAQLDRSTYLWTDDNLSTTYLFNQLSTNEIDRLVSYRNYGRVCCFKGFDAESFAFNTRAQASDYNRQFEIMGMLLALGLDLYGYVTLTSVNADNIEKKICEFIDRLQVLDTNLPLRVIPLHIQMFTPVGSRLNSERLKAMQIQEEAVSVWNSELEKRFTPSLRSNDISDIPLTIKRK